MVESQTDSMYSVDSGDIDVNDLMRVDTQEFVGASQPTSDFDAEAVLNFDEFTLESNLCQGPTDYNYNLADLQVLSCSEHQPIQPQLGNLDHLRQLPIFDELSSAWNFDVDIKCDNNGKSAWLYSSTLNKVYVKINAPMNVYPKFTIVDSSVDLFIRTMIVFTSTNDLPEPVKKCPNHKEKAHKEEPFHRDHILICENVGVEYRGVENGRLFDEKLACVVPMRNVALNEPLKLTFTCQNSCSGGMNRKSTSLIFTLEDGVGNILGRRVMHFKVCSCPRRDKEKDESTTKVLPKKRKAEPSSAPSTSKRPHLTPKEETVVEQPVVAPVVIVKQEQETQSEVKLLLPNEQMKKEVLRAAYNIVAGEMTRTGADYGCFLAEIQKQIDDTQFALE